MKIVHCVFEMEMGGSQVLVVNLMNEMATMNEMHLVILNNQADEDLIKQLDPTIKVYYLKRRLGSYNPIPLLKLNLLLLKLAPDIVHCHEDSMIRIIKVGNFKQVLTLHTIDIPLSFLNKYHRLVAVSDSVYENVSSRGRYAIGKVSNGVPDHLFTKRKHYTINKEEKVKLVQVSRLVHKIKGQDILLEALHKIVYQFKIQNISLDIVGEGPSLQYLTELSESLELKNYVNFIGTKNRNWLYTHLSFYHALVQPSRLEGFGLTIVEALRAGLPVVAANIEGPAQLLAGLPSGFLFESGNGDDCASQIMNVINLYSKNKMHSIMNDMSHRDQPYYSMADCSSGYLKIYENIMA